jgi:alpha-D-ribose 1-methylphosphonate 5-triphosphate synthase subunit PhnH
MIVTVAGAEPPPPLSMSVGVLLLTLADGTTPVHLAGGWDCPLVRDWVTFHCGAPLVFAQDAVFAVGDWAALQPVGRFAVGRVDYPDRAATLIIEIAALSNAGMRLTGPGIAQASLLSLPEVVAFQDNRALFPLGFDTFLTCGNRLAGLPRFTKVEAL